MRALLTSVYTVHGVHCSIVSLPNLISVGEHFGHMIMLMKVTAHRTEVITRRMEDSLGFMIQAVIPTHKSHLVFFDRLQGILYLFRSRVIGRSKEWHAGYVPQPKREGDKMVAEEIIGRLGSLGHPLAFLIQHRFEKNCPTSGKI